jgi:hypothetical protein
MGAAAWTVSRFFFPRLAVATYQIPDIIVALAYSAALFCFELDCFGLSLR